MRLLQTPIAQRRAVVAQLRAGHGAVAAGGLLAYLETTQPAPLEPPTVWYAGDQLVLDAQTRLVNAEAQLVNTTIQYRRNQITLLRVTGDLLQDRGIQVK